MPRAVIFDVDGTLVDSVDLHTEAWRQALSAFGKDIPFTRIREQIGKGSDQLLPVFLSPDEMEGFGEELDEHRSTIYRRQFLSNVRAFPCVRELFKQLLSDGKQIALASSAKEEELSTYCRLANIGDLVSVTVSSDDVERSKPYPDIFSEAVRQLSIPASAATVVGDTPYDAEAAERAGVASIGVLCGGFAEALLRRAGCRETHRDPADLLAHYSDSALAPL